MTKVQTERYVDCPFSVAEQGIADYLQRAAAGGPEGVLHLPLLGAGFVSLSRLVELSFEQKRDDSEPGRPHLESVIMWKSGSRLLPDFSGVIRTRIAVPGTRLILAGRYWPPLGLLGVVFDRLIGRHIAHATLRDLGKRLAISLETRHAAWRRDHLQVNQTSANAADAPPAIDTNNAIAVSCITPAATSSV